MLTLAEAQQVAFIPGSDWEDHCKAGRVIDALNAVDPGRLATALYLSVEGIAQQTGMDRQALDAMFPAAEVVDQCRQIAEARARAAEVWQENNPGLAALTEEALRWVGQTVLAGYVGADLAQWGADQLVTLGAGQIREARLATAMLEVQGTVGGFFELIRQSLQAVLSDPTVISNWERTQRTRRRAEVLRASSVVLAIVAGGAIWVRVVRAPARSTETTPIVEVTSQTDTTDLASVPVPTPMSAPAPARAVPTRRGTGTSSTASMAAAAKTTQAGAVGSGAGVPISSGRTTCIKKCIAGCNDDAACERTCVAEKCR